MRGFAGKWIPPFRMTQDFKGVASAKEVVRRVQVRVQVLAAFGDLAKYPTALRKEVEAAESSSGAAAGEQGGRAATSPSLLVAGTVVGGEKNVEL